MQCSTIQMDLWNGLNLYLVCKRIDSNEEKEELI